MVAWIPSRRVDKQKTALYTQREALSIEAASICYTAATLLYPRETEGRKERN